MKTLSIFISSPGDVVAERTIAKRVIRKLQKEFGKHVELKALLWEDMPLQSTRSFQEGINQIVDANMIDIAIFILWSRLGSPLGKDFHRPDGTPYLSGTEYEYETMLAANRHGGKPEILAYIKNAPATRILAEMNDLSAVEEWTEQNKKVQNFIKEYFYDKASNTIYGAYHQFEESTTFEKKLTEHLRRLVADKIGEAGKIEWDKNPYVGLRSFEADDEIIFYGRKRAVNDIEELLIGEYHSKGAPSLLLLGESGTGKSSVVKAGILPDFSEAGILPGTRWDTCSVTPGQFGGNPFSGILNMVASAFPALGNSQIWNDLQNGADVNYAYLADWVSHHPDNGIRQEHLFFFDQFEELFTDPSITENMRQKTIGLLEGLVAMRKIWFIFSMRSDFYHKFSSYPRLLQLKRNSLVYDLPNMYPSELQEIVEEPAKKAGLTWEFDNRSGNSLKTTIANDIMSRSPSLPLIEFALFELYAHKTENNELTFAAYEKIGKIDGAILHYADRFHANLTDKEKILFENILSATITESASGNGIYVRRTAYWDETAKNEEIRQLLIRLTDAHLLVSGKDIQDRPTLTIVHETLLTSWSVVRDWIEKEKQFIAQNNFYENCGNHWRESGRLPANLAKGQDAIRQAEFFLMHWQHTAAPSAVEYLDNSIRKFYGSHKAAYIVLLAFLLFAMASIYALGNKLTAITGLDAGCRDILPFYSILTAYVIYKIGYKHKTAPIHETVKSRLAISATLATASLAAIIQTYRDTAGDIGQEGVVTAIAYFLPLFFYVAILFNFLQTLADYQAVSSWKKRKFTLSFLSKRSSQKAMSISTYILITLMCISLLSTLGTTLEEKNNQLEQTGKLVDELFENLNGIQTKLSARDNLYVNRMRLAYLWNNHAHELTDSVVGRRDYEYALCQYNLGHPEEVPGNINPAYFTDTRLGILAFDETGQADTVRTLLWKYKQGLEKTERYSLDDFDAELIWIAEKRGEWELVEDIFNQTGLDIQTDEAKRIKHAHLLLMTGDAPQALRKYRDLISGHPLGKDKIVRDFSILRWHGFPDQAIREVEKELALPRTETHTLPSDEANTGKLASPYTGVWQREEEGAILQWEIRTDGGNVCLHRRTDAQDNELAAKATRFRMKKDKEDILLEEYHARLDRLSSSRLTLTRNDELHVRTEDGRIYIYHRKKQSDTTT